MKSGLRLRKDVAVEAVEAPDDLAADLEVALLVLADRDVVREVERDVGRHEDRVAEEAERPEVLLAELLDLLLVRRHALEPAERRDHPEDERQLGRLRDARLDEDAPTSRGRGPTDSQSVTASSVASRIARRVGVVGRQGVEVGDEVVAG